MPPYKRAGIRAQWHDYTGAGFYMITLVTAPRRNLFGSCKDNAVQLSSEGSHVVEAWRKNMYIRDNPRRYCLKKEHPDLFTRLDHLSSPNLPKGRPWRGIGNPFLLDKPLRLAIRVSRSATPTEINAKKAFFQEAIQQGAVLVSPFISPGEKEMVATAIEEGGSVIVLKHEGFPPLYKPSGAYFDLCAQGRLLILSCAEFSGQKTPLTREACLEMNSWCAAIEHGNTAVLPPPLPPPAIIGRH